MFLWTDGLCTFFYPFFENWLEPRRSLRFGSPIKYSYVVIIDCSCLFLFSISTILDT